ncbi:MAG: hypothetical protein CR991_04325 [Proteobacteria bacterium]|nr:MAG: hypothetical protein CR991_04325 [Pseudomonadota bacterium]
MAASVDTSAISNSISQMQQSNQAMLDFQSQAVTENRKFSMETSMLEHEASISEKMQSLLQTLARNAAN